MSNSAAFLQSNSKFDAAIFDGHECVVLSALMNGADALPICADDFSSPPNRMIFNRVSGLSDRGLIAVTDALRRAGELDKVGGAYRVTDISLMPHDDENLKYALDQVLERSRAQQAAKIGKQLQSGDITIDEAVVGLSKLNQRSGGLPPMEDGAELLSTAAVLPDDVVEGVLHRGAKMMLGGASKSFKTWALIDLTVSVVTGTDWLGKFPTKRGRVLYINFELPHAWFQKRLQTVCDERQVKIEPGYLKVWNLRGFAADLSKLLPLLLPEIGCGEYVLIIIDPIYKCLGARDENKAGDIATLLNEIEKLTVATDAAVAFGAHYSKGNQASKESIDRVGGSGVFARDPDSILSFTRHEEPDCFTVDARLRNHPPIEPFVARWEYPLFCVDSALDPSKLKTAGRPEQHHAKDLLELIDEPMSASEIVKVAAQECGIPRRRVFELLADLKGGGLLKQAQKRGNYEPV